MPPHAWMISVNRSLMLTAGPRANNSRSTAWLVALASRVYVMISTYQKLNNKPKWHQDSGSGKTCSRWITRVKQTRCLAEQSRPDIQDAHRNDKWGIHWLPCCQGQVLSNRWPYSLLYRNGIMYWNMQSVKPIRIHMLTRPQFYIQLIRSLPYKILYSKT